MERSKRYLIAWATVGALLMPASLALAQATATPPRPPGSSIEPPAIVPPPSSVTPPGAEAIPPSGGRYSDPQSGAQGDGQTGGSQSTDAPSKTDPLMPDSSMPDSSKSDSSKSVPSLPPIASPEASGKN